MTGVVVGLTGAGAAMIGVSVGLLIRALRSTERVESRLTPTGVNGS